MTDYGGKIGEILHDLSRFVALLCRFRRCFDHRIARYGMRTFHGPAYDTLVKERRASLKHRHSLTVQSTTLHRDSQVNQERIIDLIEEHYCKRISVRHGSDGVIRLFFTN